MMENFAVHMRIAGATPSDDEVDSRRAAASALSASWAKETTIANILSKVTDVAACLVGDGIPSPTLGMEVQAIVQKKKASSFLYSERPFEVGVCAGMAMSDIVSARPAVWGWQTADVFATAMWSALAFQAPLEAERRENLRSEVLAASEARSRLSADKVRERETVNDPADLKITSDGEGEVTTNFKTVIAGTIEALRRNAALDREELDFLWWAQLGRSRLLNRQLSDIREETRIVAAGIEGAKMLRRLPSEVHRDIVLRTLDGNPDLDLAELMTALGDDRERLGEKFATGFVAAYPIIFPFLNALASGDASGSGATIKRDLSEWGARALLEAGFLKIISEGPGKL